MMEFIVHVKTNEGIPQLDDQTKQEDFCCSNLYSHYDPDSTGERGLYEIVPVSEGRESFDFKLGLYLNISKIRTGRIVVWFTNHFERFSPISVPILYCNFCGEKISITQIDVITKGETQ